MANPEGELTRFAFGAGRWRGAASGVDHGVDELEDGALIRRRQFFNAAEPLQEARGLRARDLTDGWRTGALVGQLGLAFGVAAPVGQGADAVGAVSVAHFTSEDGAAAIEGSGNLRSGSFVARPAEVAGRSASAVESFLEIAPGRGTMQATVRVPADALKVPFNGPTTSGGAIQYQLTRPIPIKLGTFTPTP
jgi:hypothetical protein